MVQGNYYSQFYYLNAPQVDASVCFHRWCGNALTVLPSKVINFCQTYVQFGTIKTFGLNESISHLAPDASSTTQTIVIDWVSLHLAHYVFRLTTISSKYKIASLVRYLIVTRSSICVNQPELDVPWRSDRRTLLGSNTSLSSSTAVLMCKYRSTGCLAEKRLCLLLWCSYR